MVVAIVRGVPASFARAIAEKIPDPPIDVARARAQHEGYVAALRQAGATIVALPADEDAPDCCFVEDTAVIAGGIALLVRPGAESRRGEPAGVRAALAALLPVEEMAPPATLDGGDCLRLGRRLYVGRSARTNAAGAARARELFPEVIEVPFSGALHLKSLCSPLDDETVLVTEGALPPGTFGGAREILVPGDANVVAVGRTVLVADPVTAETVAAAGFTPVVVDTSELRKADGALTCLSILVAR